MVPYQPRPAIQEYFEEEKNDGAKDHHDHRGARAGAKMCRVGLATL
jgi:hypothetical protein